MAGPMLSRPLLGMMVLFVICLAIVPSSTAMRFGAATTNASGCDVGWTVIGQSCFMPLTFDRGLTFFQARYRCLLQNAELAEITNRRLHRQLTGMIGDTDSWIGLTDVLRQGVHKYGPQWLYSKSSLLGARYQPLIGIGFYLQWTGQQCFYLNRHGLVIARPGFHNYRGAICQKRRRDVGVRCPKCNVEQGSPKETRLVQRALCNDLAVQAKVENETSTHYFLDVQAICSNSSAAYESLSRDYRIRPQAASRCTPVERRPKSKLLAVQKSLSSPMRARCPQPCGAMLQVGGRYLVSGTVHRTTKEFALYSGGALRWPRARSIVDSTASTNTAC
eukprot:scpid65288/ scgid15008/ 